MTRLLLVFQACAQILLFAIYPGCSSESRFLEMGADAEATVVSNDEKSCKNDSDCTAINQDCCDTAEGIVALNRYAAFRLQTNLSLTCQNKREENPDLCKDKVADLKKPLPKVGCENGMCALKAPAGAEDASTCKHSGQCQIFDSDCCGSGENLTAINFRFSGQLLQKRTEECREKLKADLMMCMPKLKPGEKRKERKKHPAAVCYEGKCAVCDKEKCPPKPKPKVPAPKDK